MLIRNLSWFYLSMDFHIFQVYFRRKPGHFQKIVKALTPYKDRPLEPMEMWKALQPLIKGQKYLLEDFQALFLGKPAERYVF